MANIYLFKYNNYYNKLLKVQQTIEGYGDPLAIVMSSNFNPNDGIQARHVVNADFETIPDYCVVMTDYGEIESRWFVMSCKRIRKGQWHVELLRDSLAEYRSQVLEAVCFIEKGYVNNANPLVFNNENMGFNQIKSGEYLLENNLHSPWLVLYLSRYNSTDNNSYNKFSGTYVENAVLTPDYTLANFSDYPYYQFTDWNTAAAWKNYAYLDDGDLIFIAEYRRNNQPTTIRAMGVQAGSFIESLNEYGYPTGATTQNYKTPLIAADKVLSANESAWSSIAGEFNSGFISQNNLAYNVYLSRYYNEWNVQFGTPSSYKKLFEEDGKIVEIKNEFYKLHVKKSNYPINSTIQMGETYLETIDKSSSMGEVMESEFFTGSPNNIDISSDAQLNFKIGFRTNQQFLYITAEKVTTRNVSYNVDYKHTVTKDAAYEIIVAPLYSMQLQVSSDKNIFHDGNVALQGFQDMINKYHASNFIYDLQLLPYCPIESNDLSLEELGYFTNGEEGETEEIYACYIYLRKSTFSQIINIEGIPLRKDYKLSNELDVYRIVSPNGVGEYEYSPSKNGGSIMSFEVDCTLIPYNPYIKINPSFSGLYGADYDDYRGLICGGDFSLPIVSSEWETYQLQNKYYQDIFNRQIAHQEYNNKFALAGDILGATTGAVSSGVEGLRLGGGAVGAAVGAGIGIIAGTADVVTNQMLRNEEIRYQKDQFGFQLGTIKARADSLTRTTSFNQNNKYFPYIEYYTCTPVEEEALKKKMEYNGMTVGVIGKISEYLSPTYVYTYVQAELIEIDIPDDYQMVEEIARRLRGGIRIA